MKRILSILVCVVLVATFAVAPARASATVTSATNTQQIQLLMQLLAVLQSMLAQLQAQNDANHAGDISPGSQGWKQTTHFDMTTNMRTATNFPNDNSDPISFKAIVDSPAQITLSWTAPTGKGSELVAGYRLWRDKVLLADTVKGTKYVDSGLFPSTTYSYRLTSVDAKGNQGSILSATAKTAGDDPVKANWQIIQGEFFQGKNSGDIGYIRVYAENTNDIYTLEYSANCCKPTEGSLKKIIVRGDGYVNFALDTYLGNVDIVGLKVRMVAFDGEKGDWIDIVK